jgi:uncharacterized membrane protein
MRVDLVGHIIAGSLGIVFGFVALATVKGGVRHRTAGMVFVYSMVAMALLGAMMAIVRDKAPGANAPVGLLTAYLVVTAFTTVRPESASSRRIDAGLLAVVAGVTLALFTFGYRAATSPTGKLYGMPAAPFLVFGAIGLIAAGGDLRLIGAGGIHRIRGAPRLTRHLWRMCVALLIAAFSFFLGQAKVFPKPIRIVPLLVLPPLVVLGALIYWLWRIRLKRALRGVIVVGAPEVVR